MTKDDQALLSYKKWLIAPASGHFCSFQSFPDRLTIVAEGHIYLDRFLTSNPGLLTHCKALYLLDLNKKPWYFYDF